MGFTAKKINTNTTYYSKGANKIADLIGCNYSTITKFFQIKENLTKEKEIKGYSSMKKEELLNLFTPEEYCFDEENVFSNSDGDTSLSLRAMDINDDMKTTPNEKIIKLQELFWRNGHTITTLNRHLI